MGAAFHDALRRPRLLLGAGGAAAGVSFFALTWLDLLFLRATGFDLARSTSYVDGKTTLLWVVAVAAVVAVGAAARDDKRLVVLAGVLAAAGVVVLLYGIFVAAQGTRILGERFSLLGYLGLGYWSTLLGLLVTCAGACTTFRPPAARTSAPDGHWTLE